MNRFFYILIFLSPFSLAYQEACPDAFSADEYISYAEAKHYVKTVVYPKSKKDFYRWLVSDERPIDFPKNPKRFYQDEWEGIDKFLDLPTKDDNLRETREEKRLRMAIERMQNPQTDLLDRNIRYYPNSKAKI